MKKVLLLFLLLCVNFISAQIKMGSNPGTIGASSLLELESATKALVISRVDNTTAIVTPVNGMIIYDNSLGCIRVFQSGSWSMCFGGSATSNGTAIIDNLDCGPSNGPAFVAGTPVTNATQTISMSVNSPGSYVLKATANGVTFSGSGIFNGIGYQTVVLTGSGTPLTDATTIFNLNVSPSCSFTRTVNSASTNGTAVVSSYSCTTDFAGTLSSGTPVNGVTQTLTAAVTRLGTYTITTTVNGVTFSGSGTFTGTGNQNVVLTATGTPLTSGATTFTLDTTPGCSFIRNVNQPSTNGSGVVSSYTCSTNSAGTLTAGTAVSGVSQTLTADVTTIGTYAISCVTNGVTFSGSGTFAGTGNQSVVLTATGMPTTSGSHNFTLNTTPNCSFSRTVVASSVICPTIVDTFPATQMIGGTSVTITSTTNSTIGTSTAPLQCDLSLSGNVINLTDNEFIEYNFSTPIKNVQFFTADNDRATGDLLVVKGYLNGVQVNVQVAPVLGGTCNSNFNYNVFGPTMGGTQVKTGISGQNALVFTVTSSSAFTSISVARAGAAGQNSVGLLLCNAQLGP